MKFTKIVMISVACAGVLSTNAFASNKVENRCDTNINAEIDFANNQLLVKSSVDQDVIFQTNGDVSVDGIPITLTSAEQKLSKSYYDNVEETIPMVVEVTLETIDIAKLALSEVFDGLLGDDNKISSQFNTRLVDAGATIQQHVYQNPDSLTLNSVNLKKELGLGTDVKQELIKLQQEMMTAATGELLIIVGKSMMSGNNDFEDLQKRMEGVGEQIEKKVDLVGKQIEQKADIICNKLKALDETESQLQSISGLRYLNVLDVYTKA